MKNENQKMKDSLTKEKEKTLKLNAELTESEKRFKVHFFGYFLNKNCFQIFFPFECYNVLGNKNAIGRSKQKFK